MTCCYRKKIAQAMLLMLLMSNASHALIVKLSDMQTMAQQSDIVIHGYVGEKNVVTDDMGRLVTLTQIAVIDGMYGAQTSDIITVYQVGGQKDGIVMPLLGGHTYELGQEVILFGLKLDDTYVSYGAGLGKLDVIQDQGNEVVREDLGSVSALSNDPKSHDPVFRPMPLTYSSSTILKSEIREMLKTRS